MSIKIVQTFWSKPTEAINGGGNHLPRNYSGWPDRKYNYFSWALSALQFRKFYNEVELVTDKAGCELLINKLHLPYTEVKVVLDDLNDYNAALFAIGKIFAYSIQERPFIHADGDVYIWKKFDDHFEHSALLCQRKEEGLLYHRIYYNIFIQIARHFDYYPPVLIESMNKNNGIKAINAGIIGGTNLDFINSFARDAFDFVNKNRDNLDKIDLKGFNQVFEQFLFYALAEKTGEPINYLHPNAHDLVNDYADYTGVPDKTKYIHTPGAFKQLKYIADSLEYRLHKDHPDYYSRIMHLLTTYEI
jgi:hypothetical protein